MNVSQCHSFVSSFIPTVTFIEKKLTDVEKAIFEAECKSSTANKAAAAAGRQCGMDEVHAWGLFVLRACQGMSEGGTGEGTPSHQKQLPLDNDG